MAGEGISAVGIAGRDRLRLAQVRAALLLGHRHADGQAGLLRVGQVARVVDAGRDFGLPEVGQVGLQPQGCGTAT